MYENVTMRSLVVYDPYMLVKHLERGTWEEPMPNDFLFVKHVPYCEFLRSPGCQLNLPTLPTPDG